jgi:hypothetical protein
MRIQTPDRAISTRFLSGLAPSRQLGDQVSDLKRIFLYQVQPDDATYLTSG